MLDLYTSRDCNICLSKENLSSVLIETPDGVTKQKLKTCSGCQLIQYCGTDHQKLDWNYHKEFCRAVQKIIKICNSTSLIHPLALRGEPKTKKEMESRIKALKILLRLALKRPLHFYEQELTSFPSYCAICFSLKRPQYICNACRGVSYCSQEHAQQHSAQHSQKCKLFELYYCPFKLIEMQAENVPFRCFLEPYSMRKLREEDLKDAIEFTTKVKMPEIPTASLKAYQHFTYVANFSSVATICYVLAHLNVQPSSKQKIAIFIIGATNEETLYFQKIHTCFFFLHYPYINELSLYYIGPEVEHDTGSHSQTFVFLGSKRTVTHTIYRGMIEKFMEEKNVRPTLIIAYNCGFSEFPYKANEENENNEDKVSKPISDDSKLNTWFDGLCAIAKAHLIPIFFTSYTRREGEADYVELLKAANVADYERSFNVCRIMNLIQNPYRDIRPFRNWELTDDDEIFYRNGYIQGLITKVVDPNQ